MSFLSLSSIRSSGKCPAIFSQAPAQKVSNHYSFVNTLEMLQAFEEMGWGVTETISPKVRKASKETAKHMVRLRSFSDTGNRADLGTLFPEIVIVNSHDWSSRLQVFLGLFRLVCSNGLIIGTNIEGISVRHENIGISVREIAERISSQGKLAIQRANDWAAISLDGEQIRQLGVFAARLRNPVASEDILSTIGRSLTESHRFNDDGDSLWNVMNRIQENMMLGGFRIAHRRSRPLRNISAVVSANTALWNEAERLAIAM